MCIDYSSHYQCQWEFIMDSRHILVLIALNPLPPFLHRAVLSIPEKALAEKFIPIHFFINILSAMYQFTSLTLWVLRNRIWF